MNAKLTIINEKRAKGLRMLGGIVSFFKITTAARAQATMMNVITVPV